MVNGGIATALVAACLLGLRHGVDYDHVAAIADLSGAADSPSRGIWLSLLYGLGHAAVVLLLGGICVVFGMVLPAGADRVVRGGVGLTLIVLGSYVLSALIAQPNARPATRFELLQSVWRWLCGQKSGSPATAPNGPSAFGVGIIHGVGAETPTQLSLFVLSAGIGGWEGGMLCVALFVAGLLAMNALMAVLSVGVFGVSGLREPIYRTVMLVAGSYSIALGVWFVVGGIARAN